MKNNLDKDPSPYLQQHKNNPVNWQVWSKEILDLAKKLKKPILLSVGYASCHWCHVMAHESFEDKETAELMNKYFINIKVDREERPDIDFVFQNSYQIFNQASGGWPLTMFLDENGVPFMGGTYFPKISSHGLPSFKEVLKKIGSIYTEQRIEITKQSPLIIKNLELKKSSVVSQNLDSILQILISNLDADKGGYKGTPKFPIFNVYETLIYFYNKNKDSKLIKPIEIIVNKLCSQGIYDQVEGGISRYAIDDDWMIPHFEKMLYDNCQFISLLSKYAKIDKKDYYKKKIIQTINFINDNFFVPKRNLLGSSYDADSEGEEGKYYVFNHRELSAIENIEKYFDIKPEGNWEGKIILKEKTYPPEGIISKLRSIRKKKVKPAFDNKIQLDLNCFWISSLISANSVVPNKKFLENAEIFFNEIDQQFLQGEIYHSNSRDISFLEDFAYVINALIDLNEATLKPKYKFKAVEICKQAIDQFYVKEKKIFQKNKIKYNDLFHNPIDISDHTIPNGNSIMLLNLTRLGFKKESQELATSLNGYLNNYKSFMASGLKAIDYFNEISAGKNCDTSGCKS
ncbi:DUF255 domain-containing protein [Pelagibacteraceae bacterium]|jgi:uncharacterized protein YyaL (SSP411 family)|nr:DUF255 domain-containing protein [Pelagibacteraceae bacterium]|tara:strand:- start:1137 stop:2852 length:1716 start_codon:yes stop_codon:yes gene_type:complete